MIQKIRYIERQCQEICRSSFVLAANSNGGGTHSGVVSVPMTIGGRSYPALTMIRAPSRNHPVARRRKQDRQRSTRNDPNHEAAIQK